MDELSLKDSILDAISKNHVAALACLLSNTKRGILKQNEWIEIVNRAFQTQSLLPILDCLSSFDSIAVVVDSSQDVIVSSLVRGNTALHWLFDWFSFFTSIPISNDESDKHQSVETLERVFWMLLPEYESKYDLAELDTASSYPLALLAVSNSASFRLFCILQERHHLVLDRLGANGCSALHVAIAQRQTDAISFLLTTCPALMERKDAYGLLPQDWAKSHEIDLDLLK